MAKAKTGARGRKEAHDQEEHISSAAHGAQAMVHISDIDISPLTYRRYYTKQTLDDLAGNLKQSGIAVPLIVRPMPSGRYELVVEELTFLAAQLALIPEVPITVTKLSDSEVRELQFAEHVKNGSLHPLHEAIAIQHLLDDQVPIEEIAVRFQNRKSSSKLDNDSFRSLPHFKTCS